MRILFLALALSTLLTFTPASYAQDLPPQSEEMKEKALAGDVTAQFEFGKHVSNGVKMNEVETKQEQLQESLKWFEMAAKQGHVEAQFMSGYLRMATGKNLKTEAQMTEAAKIAYAWLAAANAQEHEGARYMFNQMQEGLPKRAPEHKKRISIEEFESIAKEYIALYVTPFQNKNIEQKTAE